MAPNGSQTTTSAATFAATLRDWPHRHRRLHRNEEEILAKELRIPLAQLHAANAKGGMFDLTRLPSDEKERREKVLGLATHGRSVYTANAGRLRTIQSYLV
jgi:hypothetical protein